MKVKQVCTIAENTREYTPELIHNEVQECACILESLGYSVLKNFYEVEIDSRPKRRMGRCLKLSEDHYKISISKNVLLYASSFGVHNVIMHEVIHSVEGCYNHGPNFKNLAKLVNREYIFTTISRFTNDPQYSAYIKQAKEQDKYLMRCIKCGATFKRKRHSELVWQSELGLCTCRKCHGKFEVIQLR